MYTIVPLGNPGSRYEKTRHNAGRIVVDILKDKNNLPEGLEVFVPSTFMNESGKDVATYLRYHSDREIVVVYDDKDLAFGTFRISYDRSDGGHNGVKSIIESIGTKAFIRLRIGIAPKNEEGVVVTPHGEQVQGYVMAPFSGEERKSLEEISLKIRKALEDIAMLGYQKAMERNN